MNWLDVLKKKVCDNAPTIMSWLATFGTVGGSVLAATGVGKAKERKYEAITQKEIETIDRMHDSGATDEEIQKALDDCHLTVGEWIKACVPPMIPCVLTEGFTIGMIHGSNAANQKIIARANGTAAAAMAAYAAYADSVGQITDRTTEFAAKKRVEKQEESRTNGEPPWDETQLFCVDGYSGYFKATREEIFKVEYEANRIFALKGSLTRNELFGLLGLPQSEYGSTIGWDDYLGEVYYGYHWIDFTLEPVLDKNGLTVTRISMPFAAHSLDEDEVNAELSQKLWNQKIMEECIPKPI